VEKRAQRRVSISTGNRRPLDPGTVRVLSAARGDIREASSELDGTPRSTAKPSVPCASTGWPSKRWPSSHPKEFPSANSKGPPSPHSKLPTLTSPRPGACALTKLGRFPARVRCLSKVAWFCQAIHCVSPAPHLYEPLVPSRLLVFNDRLRAEPGPPPYPPEQAGMAGHHLPTRDPLTPGLPP
jgi:hypothetical protein